MKKPLKLLSSLALFTATALSALFISGCNRCCDTQSNCCVPTCQPTNCCPSPCGPDYYQRSSRKSDFSSKFQLNQQSNNWGNGNCSGGSCSTGYCPPASSPSSDCGSCASSDFSRNSCDEPRATPPCPGDNVVNINSELIRVTKQYPGKVELGTEYRVQMIVRAVDNANNVVITETIPHGASFVRSQPESTVNGNQISFVFDRMQKCQTKVINLWLQANNVGELCGCTNVTAMPVPCAPVCAPIFVGQACLECHKTGPARINCDDFFEFMITVKNTGNAVARCVVVTENLPKEVEHASGQRVLKFTLGDLQPGECRQIPVRVKALTRCVRVCNTVTTTSSNCEQKSCECCLDICKSIVKIQKTGPCEQYICKVAPYQITIHNEGDNVLHNVVVTDIAPQNTTIVKAPGASICGNRAVWVVPCLNPNESRSFCLNLTSQICGVACNQATVKASDGCGDQTELCTTWKGCSGITACLTDCEDPVCLGQTAFYKLHVRNQGTAADKNVAITFRFDDKLCPISGSGPTQACVSGNTITFKPIPCLAPKQSVEYTVRAKTVGAGDARVKAEMTSEFLTSPVTEEESTQIY